MYETEQELIAACLSGEPEAWHAFKQRYARLIRAAALRTSSVDEATLDDLEAIVYQKLLEDRCRRMRAWQGRARFSTYLVQVTRNLVLDWVDSQRRSVNTLPLDDRTDAPAASQEPGTDEAVACQAKALHEAIARLPERQAVIMRMRLAGQSLRDIAHLLGRPVGTVSVESSRAMEKLRTLLEQDSAFASGIET